MSALLAGLLIIGGSTALALLGMYLVRKFIAKESVKACHEVGGYLLAVVGTLYAILVGMIVVESQGKIDQARQMSVTEANMLSNIYHLSRSFKQPTKQIIRDSLYNYALAVEAQDWSLVEQGKENEATIPHYRNLWRAVTDYSPQEQNQQQCYATMLGNLEQLSDARRYRMVAAKGGLSSVLWAVLIVGGAMIVMFTYFFFLESMLSQTIMTSFVVIFLALNVYLIYIYQNPYRPELEVKKTGFGFSFNPQWFKDSPEHTDKD